MLNPPNCLNVDLEYYYVLENRRGKGISAVTEVSLSHAEFNSNVYKSEIHTNCCIYPNSRCVLKI